MKTRDTHSHSLRRTISNLVCKLVSGGVVAVATMVSAHAQPDMSWQVAELPGILTEMYGEPAIISAQLNDKSVLRGIIQIPPEKATLHLMLAVGEDEHAARELFRNWTAQMSVGPTGNNTVGDESRDWKPGRLGGSLTIMFRRGLVVVSLHEMRGRLSWDELHTMAESFDKKIIAIPPNELRQQFVTVDDAFRKKFSPADVKPPAPDISSLVTVETSLAADEQKKKYGQTNSPASGRGK